MALERLGLGAVLEFATASAVGNMATASKAAKQLQSSFQGIGRAAARTKRGVGQIASGISSLVVPTVLAAGGAAGIAVKKYLGFEEALTKIATILPGGGKAAEAWGDSIQDMGVKFGKASKDVGEGVYQAISASVPAGEALQFLDVVGRTATGGFTDLGASVKVVASTVNAYGKQLGETATYTDRATRASDVLLKAVELGQIEFTEMASTLGYILPTAAGAKVSMEEVAAAWATATASGQSASSSATALRQTIGAIIAPTKKARDQAEALGIQFNQQALEEKGLLGILKDVGKATGGNTKQLDDLFGSIEALNIVMALSQDEAGAFEKNLAAMNTAAGTTDRQFQAVAESSGFKLRQVWSALGVLAEQVGGAILKGLGIEGVGKLADLIQAKTPAIVAGVERFIKSFREGFGQTIGTLKRIFLPILDKLAPKAGTLAEKIGSIAGRITPLIPLVGGLSMVAGPLFGILSGGVNVVGGLGTGFVRVLGLVGQLSGAGGLGGLLPMLAAGPLGLVGLAVGAGVALLGLTGHGQELKDMFGAVVGVVKDVAGAIGSVLGPVLSGIADVITEVAIPAIKGLISWLGDALSKVGSFMDSVTGIPSNASEINAKILANPKFTNTPLGRLLGVSQEQKGVAALRQQGIIGGVTQGTSKEAAASNAFARDAAEAVRQQFAGQQRAKAVKGQAVDVAKTAAEAGQLGAAIGSAVGKIAGRVQERVAPVGPVSRVHEAQLRKEEAKRSREAKRQAARERASQKCVEVNSKLHVDGREMHAASSRSRLELTERAGAQVTPYQRRQIIERGAVGGT